MFVRGGKALAYRYNVLGKLFSTSNLSISEEVRCAINNAQPVVALESTIVTHGMPYPDNLKIAMEVEATVRNENCTPATVAVLNGKLQIGLNESQLEELASGRSKPVKVSRRDLPFVLSQGLNGGTTVSATMIAAHLAGIRIFSTGGIGGVHRDGERSMDVSSDLTELGRTPVTVVSAGVKSILDIGRTLEYLETQGVAVAVFGDNVEFPAFFTSSSGFPAPNNVKNAMEAARLIESRDSLNLSSGVLVAVPVPASGREEGLVIEEAIQEALQLARVNGIVGKDVTPYVLAKVNELSQGASLAINRLLVLNNARVASRIALQLAHISTSGAENGNVAGIGSRATERAAEISVERRPVVVGASNVDIVATLHEDLQWLKTRDGKDDQSDGCTYPGTVSLSLGGVGRNIADCLARLGARPFFISSVGNDPYGKMVLEGNPQMNTDGIAISSSASTGKCSVVLNRNRECELLVGDFGIHEQISVEQVREHEEIVKRASMLILDANIPVETTHFILNLCAENKIPVWYEPTDINKADRVFRSANWTRVTCASPNLHELRVMSKAVGSDPGSVDGLLDDFNENALKDYCLTASITMLKTWKLLVVTLGSLGVMTVSRRGERLLETQEPIRGDVVASYYPIPIVNPSVVSVTGAGDCLAAGIISSLLKGQSLDKAVRNGLKLSAISISSPNCVPDIIKPDWFL